MNFSARLELQQELLLVCRLKLMLAVLVLEVTTETTFEMSPDGLDLIQYLRQHSLSSLNKSQIKLK